MGLLYLVRHGQASFGAQDYDQLSELGQRQSLRLGQYWQQRGLSFDAVLTGTLRRHAQTWSGIAQGGGYAHQALTRAELNEYDSAALMACVSPQTLAKPDTPERYRQHFRLLREALAQWMNASIEPQAMPSYREFLQGITQTLDDVRRQYCGNVLLVSSGGPIASAIGHVLGSAAQTTIEFNMRLRNSAVSVFDFNPKRHSLLSFNSVAHLDVADDPGLITYA